MSRITVWISAKSRLIRPGLLIRSVTPCTPCCNTSSAFFKASGILVRLSQICNSLSFGMTIRVSTFSFNFAIPLMALFIRGLPSKENGFVTTPTVRIPRFLAISATTGAAPVPVPPPIPQVTNTILASFIVVARFCDKICLSVLMAINSTPSTFSSIILFTALLPAPPTPITRILAGVFSSFDFISSKVFSSFILFAHYYPI